MKKRLSSFFNRTHREQGGQALIFASIVMFTLVCFIAFTINVGNRITKKVQMQNAADSAALTGAIWHARGLNLVSILNVGMTECLAMIIMFKAFDKTTWLAKTAMIVQMAVCAAASVASGGLAAAYCGLVVKTHHFVSHYYQKVADALKNVATDGGAPFNLWDMMRIFQSAENATKYAIPWVAAYDASRIAKLNKASSWTKLVKNIAGNSFQGVIEAISGEKAADVEPVDEQIKDDGSPPSTSSGLYSAVLLPIAIEPLPITEGRFEDLCGPTAGQGYNIYGSKYLNWKALIGDYNALGMSAPFLPGDPALKTFFTTSFSALPTPPLVYGIAFESYVKIISNSLCPGSVDPEDINKKTLFAENSCSKCPKGADRYKEVYFNSKTEEIASKYDEGDDNSIPEFGEEKNPDYFWEEVYDNTCGAKPKSPTTIPSGYEYKKTVEDYDKKHGEKPCEKCDIKTEIYIKYKQKCKSLPLGGKICWKVVDKTKKIYFRRQKRITCYVEKDLPMNDVKVDADASITPFMLEGNWEDDLKFTAIVYKAVDDKIKIGIKSGVDYTFALAQAEVYNDTLRSDAEEKAYKPTPLSGLPILFNQDFEARLKEVVLTDTLPDLIQDNLPEEIKNFLNNASGALIVH